MSSPLFPSGKVAQQQGTDIIAFSSFQPPPSDGKLEELLSSSDEATPSKKRQQKEQKISVKTKKRKSHKDQSEDYYIDKKGDELNLSFQGLYRLDVSAYRPQRLCSSIISVSNAACNTERYFSPKQVFRQRSKKFKRLKLLDSMNKGEASDSDEAYLPLEFQDESEVTILESIEDEILRKTREFNIQLRKTPHDLSLWKKFASFQDEAIHLTKRRVSIANLAEKKISILARALHHHPKDEEILSLLMKLNALVVSPMEAQEKFESILQRLPHSLVIWDAYMHHLKSTFTEFSAEKVQSVYQGCMKGVEEGIQTKALLVVKAEESEEDLVLAFLLGVQFDIQCGYEEKALGKIQSCLEWIFCSPGNRSSLSQETLLQFFQKFWENEDIPKIGQPNAKGFLEYVDQQILDPGFLKMDATKGEARREDMQIKEDPNAGWSGWFEAGDEPVVEEDEARIIDEQESEKEEDTERTDEEDEEAEDNETEQELLKELGLKLEEIESTTSISVETFDRFFETEIQRSNSDVLPKYNVEKANLDLDRVLLFEEFQPLLFDLSEANSKKKLLLGVFSLLELDISDLVCSMDPFFIRLEAEIETTPVWLQQGLKEFIPDVEKLTPWYLCHPHRGYFVLSLLEFFAVELFPSDLRIRKLWMQTAVQIEKKNNTNSDVFALGKCILAQYKEDLNLWTAYGSILMKERPLQGQKVWCGVLQQLAAKQKQDFEICVQSLVREALQAIELEPRCLLLATFAVTEDIRYLFAFLKRDDAWNLEAKYHGTRALESVIKIISKQEMSWEDYDWLICAAYFSAFCTDTVDSRVFARQIQAKAAQWLDRHMDALSTQRATKQMEAIHETYCSWCVLASLPPKELKNTLLRSLQCFSHSRILLRLFVEVHMQSNTISALLLDLKSHVFKSPTVTTVILVLLLEELRSVRGINLPSLYERIVKLEEGKLASSPVIWRLFIASTTQQSNMIKRIFLRAIRACPWNKAIWMEGLKSCVNLLSGNELREFLETMKEKGIRLRTDIYEILLEEAA